MMAPRSATGRVLAAGCAIAAQLAQTHRESRLDGAGVFVQRSDRLFVLNDAGRRESLHRTDDGGQILCAGHPSGQYLGGAAHVAGGDTEVGVAPG